MDQRGQGEGERAGGEVDVRTVLNYQTSPNECAPAPQPLWRRIGGRIILALYLFATSLFTGAAVYMVYVERHAESGILMLPVIGIGWVAFDRIKMMRERRWQAVGLRRDPGRR